MTLLERIISIMEGLTLFELVLYPALLWAAIIMMAVEWWPW